MLTRYAAEVVALFMDEDAYVRLVAIAALQSLEAKTHRLPAQHVRATVSMLANSLMLERTGIQRMILTLAFGLAWEHFPDRDARAACGGLRRDAQ